MSGRPTPPVPPVRATAALASTPTIAATPPVAPGLADHGIFSMLRAGLDEPTQRRELIPSALLLFAAWLGFLAWIGPFVQSPVAAAVLAAVPRPVLLWGVPALLLGVAVGARAAGRRGLAVLAVMLAAYHAGNGLIGIGYAAAAPLTDTLGDTPWLRFIVRRAIYAAAVCLPMAAIAIVLLRRGEVRLGLGDWRARTRMSRKDAPITWRRALLGVGLFGALPVALLMQAAVRFEPVVTGAIVGIALPVLLMSLVNATAEELIFRGFALPAAVRAAGAPRGLWLIGIWFGLHHLGLAALSVPRAGRLVERGYGAGR
jgi:membrane protease YdiL (CAAX protease family)